MSVSNTTVDVIFTGDGSTTEFVYNQFSFLTAEIEVYLDGIKQTSGFTATGTTDPNSDGFTKVTIDFTAAPASGVEVLLRRNLALTQLISYARTGTFPAKSHEQALDRAMMVLQQKEPRITKVKLAAAQTALAFVSEVMQITGDAGGNTLATITGAQDGQRLTLIFVDALVTITDDNTHAADSVDLSAAFTSADDTVLELVRAGGSWYEVSRSAN